MSVEAPDPGAGVVRRRARRELLEHALMLAGAATPATAATYVKTLTALGLAIPAVRDGHPIAHRATDPHPTDAHPTDTRPTETR